MPRWVVIHGDCRTEMAKLEAGSADSGVLDPPYGLGFMGAEWDKFGSGRKGEKAAFKAFMRQVATQYLHALKPGSFVLVFGGTRTYHWMADAWEDAGFEVRDMMQWLYGQGFPKSLNLAKAIAKRMGVKPTRTEKATLGMANNPDWNELKNRHVMPEFEDWPPHVQEVARPWLGFGTALKPACEPLMLARAPLATPSVLANVLEHGTGVLNLDGCRVGGEDGRWPSNVMLDELAGMILDEQSGTSTDGVAVKRNGKGGSFCHTNDPKLGAPAPDQGYGGKGGASRFFYCPKPSKKEKEAGLKEFAAVTAEEMTGRKEGSAGLVMTHDDGRPKANPYAGTSGAVPRKNPHPTVKPVALLRYLTRLITPTGGTVLDAFCGSGSCGIAATLEGFNYVGIELDPEQKGFVEVARARIHHHAGPSAGLSQTEGYQQVIRGMGSREPVVDEFEPDPYLAGLSARSTGPSTTIYDAMEDF